MKKTIVLRIAYKDLCKDFAKRFGMNAYYAGKHWAQRKSDAEYWHAITRRALHDAGIKARQFEKPVSVKFYWNDKLDIDNHAAMGKMIVDGLKGYLIEDDNRKHLQSVQHFFHDQNFILVEVSEIKSDAAQQKKQKAG